MKTLLLLRHAKSSWGDDGLPDHDRPLNKRGKKTAPQMGRLLVDRELVPDLIVSSSAKRARKTAEAVAKASGFEGPMRVKNELYLATAGELLRQAQAEPDKSHHRVMLVAHNPGMEDLVRVLSGRREPFPTAALAVFEVSIDRWKELELGVRVKLLDLIRPKELD